MIAPHSGDQQPWPVVVTVSGMLVSDAANVCAGDCIVEQPRPHIISSNLQSGMHGSPCAMPDQAVKWAPLARIPGSALTSAYSLADKSRMLEDKRRRAPAAARNRAAILDVLQRFLPRHGLVLEIASGSGEHVTHFAQAVPGLAFQPSDPEPTARASIDAWVSSLGLTNVRPAIALDAAASEWPLAQADMVACINMVHIAPWSAAVGLVRGAARILPEHGLLYLYGPFRRVGRHTAPSNERFDQDLRAQNAEWGVRDLESVADLAWAAGFAPPIVEAMPANNLSVFFRRLSPEVSR